MTPLPRFSESSRYNIRAAQAFARRHGLPVPDGVIGRFTLTRGRQVYGTYRFMRGPGGPSRWRALRVARWLTAPRVTFDERQEL